MGSNKITEAYILDKLNDLNIHDHLDINFCLLIGKATAKYNLGIIFDNFVDFELCSHNSTSLLCKYCLNDNVISHCKYYKDVSIDAIAINPVVEELDYNTLKSVNLSDNYCCMCSMQIEEAHDFLVSVKKALDKHPGQLKYEQEQKLKDLETRARNGDLIAFEEWKQMKNYKL